MEYINLINGILSYDHTKIHNEEIHTSFLILSAMLLYKKLWQLSNLFLI